MYATNDSFARITDIVHDFLFVEINSTALQNKTFEYKIISQEEKLIRKGHFEGPMVQLRLSLMQEGKYTFQLYLNGEQLLNSGFEKRAGFSNYSLSLNNE